MLGVVSGKRLWQPICCGHGDALLSCQVDQLKEELSHSQSENDELRQRANELQREVSAVRDTPLCHLSFFLSSFVPSFLPSFLPLFLSFVLYFALSNMSVG